MTLRLYYDDPYLTKFTANVIKCIEKDGKWAVLLDQSAFYPTSGGQPYDTGLISGAEVSDVYVDGGDVWHIVDKPLAPGARVDAAIDWARRFDHMQQHAGEHMLANAVYRLLNGVTIGLHLGAEISTIDVELPNGQTHVDAQVLRQLEDDVNTRIQRDVPIRQWFPTPDELAKLSLRKKPSVTEHVRVVQIGELEFCACGGTHPSSAGQIGLFKIVDARPSRGKLRLGFVCGKRAFNLLRENYDILHSIASDFSASADELGPILDAQREQLKQVRFQVSQLRAQLLIKDMNDMIINAQLTASGVRVVARAVEGDVAAIRELANGIIARGGMIALLSAPSADGFVYVAAKSEDVDANMGALLSGAAKKTGGKGGGRADFAQGGGPKAMLDQMLQMSLEF